MLGRIVIGALMLVDIAGSTVAATTHDFYKGKTVKILVGGWGVRYLCWARYTASSFCILCGYLSGSGSSSGNDLNDWNWFSC
jgi:hypothetical protein